MESGRAGAVGGDVCAKHRLRVAPDGLCVLCRRNAGAPEKGSLASLRWILGAMAFGLVFVGIVAFLRADRVPIRREVVESEAESGQPPGTADEGTARERGIERARRNMEAREAREREEASAPDRVPPKGEGREVVTETVVTEKKTRSASPEEVQAALNQVSVRLYTTSWCRYCKQARAFLERNRVRFVEFDIELDSAAKDRAKLLNPKGGVPVVEVEDVVITGFSETGMAQALARAIEKRVGVPVTGMTSPK